MVSNGWESELNSMTGSSQKMMFYEYFKNGLLLWRLSEQMIHVSLRKEMVADGYVLIIQDTLSYVVFYSWNNHISPPG